MTAVLRFQLLRFLRDRLTWAAFGCFLAVVSLGAWIYWSSLPPRPAGSRSFGDAYVLALIIALHCGIARERLTSFDTYLVNFIRPRDLYFGSIAASLLMLLFFALAALFVNLIASFGDFRFAMQAGAVMFFATLWLVPGSVLVELALNTRYPVPVLVLLTIGGLTLYRGFGDLNRLMATLGLDGKLTGGRDLAEALVRSVVILLITFALYPLYRQRLGFRGVEVT